MEKLGHGESGIISAAIAAQKIPESRRTTTAKPGTSDPVATEALLAELAPGLSPSGEFP